MEELLEPDISSWASRRATNLGESTSDSELSEVALLWARHLAGDVTGDVGREAVDGKIAMMPVRGVDWVVGTYRAEMASSIDACDCVGGGGTVRGVVVGRGVGAGGGMDFEGLGVALLHSSLPNGKLSLYDASLTCIKDFLLIQ